MDLLKRLLKPLGRQTSPQAVWSRIPPTRTSTDLADRLGMTVAELEAVSVTYRSFQIQKRGGGWRTISAPEPDLMKVQRRILRRTLLMPAHPAVLGFERGRSTVQNAALHAGRAVVLRMDVQSFFDSTRSDRVAGLFANLGWNDDAVSLLTRLTTYHGSLPQGASTSPRLSTLVNRRLDERLDGLAREFDGRYSRYADDLTFSFVTDGAEAIHAVIRTTKKILAEDGYVLHERRKLQIRRAYERQVVSGLVVNVAPRLPRERRRWLRAVEHHAATGRPVSLSGPALAGWRAYRSMVEHEVQ